mgnify:CR=1 FL=1
MILNSKKEYIRYLIFLVVIYIFLFRDLFIELIPVFSFFDEIFALLALPIFLYNLFKNKGLIEINKMNWVVLLVVFFSIGLLGNIKYHYQPFVEAVLPDLFLNLKFWLTLYIGSEIFGNLDFYRYGKRIVLNIKFIIWIYIILFFIDNLSGGIFPADIRYNFRSTQFFYGAHTVFAAICIFLIALLTIIKERVSQINFYLVVLLLLLISTMRSKAFIAAIIYILVYYLILVLKKKINIKYIIMLVLIGIIIGITQIQFYFFNDLTDDIARVGMLVASIFIGIDHFPLGAGFGTFASFYSGQVYSPLYIDYDISWMYGLTEDHPSLVSDAFWPMIIGQNGYIGLIIFIIILVKIFKEIQKIYYIDKYKYMSGIFVFLYLMIASLAESAFVHPIAMPLALILGICLKKKSI